MISTPKQAFEPPAVPPVEKIAYLIGCPISHSRSPGLHDAIAATTATSYAQVLVESADLEAFMYFLRNHAESPKPKLLGSGVTMPHKLNVIPYLDQLTPEAKAIGAVNTIFLRKVASNADRLEFWGTNTDCVGIRDAFLNNMKQSMEPLNSIGLVLGGGGTCRAAIYALQTFLGCTTIYMVNRDASEVESVIRECKANGTAQGLVYVQDLQQAKDLEPPSLIVSAVPDFSPKTEGEKAARELVEYFLHEQQPSKRGALLEMCYHPQAGSSTTEITRLASENEWQVIGGLAAMIGQGLEQAKLWAGVEVDANVYKASSLAVSNQS